VYTVEPDAMQALTEHDWPGNVRELANVLERAQILAEGTVITVDDLPDSLMKPITLAGAGTAGDPDNLHELERRQVREVLRKYQGNKMQAAKALGISRRSLYRLILKHQLADEAELSSLTGTETQPEA
jgi:DNA-binding NtrC family response regulator